jgi:fluoride ion exporter CrcB/FEX
VAVGGTLGALARDLLLRAVPAGPFAVPWMLVGLNLVGSAALGVLAARYLDPHPGAVGQRLFLATDLCWLVDLGAATRFGKSLPWGTIAVNIVGSCAAGALAGVPDSEPRSWWCRWCSP